MFDCEEMIITICTELHFYYRSSFIIFISSTLGIFFGCLVLNEHLDLILLSLASTNN